MHAPIGVSVGEMSEPAMKLFKPGMKLAFGRILFAFGAAPMVALAEQPLPDPFSLYRDVRAPVEAATTFSVHVEKQFDVVMLDGAMVLYSGALDILAERAGALHIDYGDDLSAKELWYDGTTLTLIDHLHNVYAQVPAEGRVATMLVDLDERYGLQLPLSPLLSAGIADDFEDHVRSASYLGIHDAEGEPCHHVLFRGTSVDLQAWITIGEKPLLRKMVVTFRDIEGSPQQTLIFSDWNLKARANSRDFKAKIPDDAVRTEFLVLSEE